MNGACNIPVKWDVDAPAGSTVKIVLLLLKQRERCLPFLAELASSLAWITEAVSCAPHSKYRFAEKLRF